MKNPYEIWSENLMARPGAEALGDSKEVLKGKEALDLVDRLCVAIDRALNGRTEPCGIGILLSRDNTYLAAMFAVWRMGHYFIPLNSRWPPEHLAKILNKAKPGLVIGGKIVEGWNTLVVSGLVPARSPDQAQNERWNRTRAKARLAYTIFTSGSTGEQKGVMISLSAYGEYIRWAGEYFKAFRDNKALLITAELTFDITLGDIAFALNFGTAIHVSPDPRHMFWHAKLISDRRIDTFYSVPSTIRSLFFWVKDREDISFDHMKLVVAGGDSFPWEMVDLVKDVAPEAEFHNVYGPTEVTINCVATRVDDLGFLRSKGNPVPIGRPFAHLKSLLWDKDNSCVAVDQPGELLIGGGQGMDGYMGDPGMTDKAFMKVDGIPYYKTGDLVSRDKEGYHYMLGRVDNLVKVRGYRINPVEIDNVIADAGIVREVKTLTFRPEESKKQIVVFYVPQKEDGKAEEQIEKLCRQKLPAYMVPDDFVAMDQFPVGHSGKYDLSQLRSRYFEHINVS